MTNSSKEWSIPIFPAFPAGNLVEKAYTTTMSFRDSDADKQDYIMLITTDTEAADFIAYADALAADGFSVKAHAQNAEEVLSYWVASGENRMYMYYTASTKQARFILDRFDTVSLEDFEYRYEKQEGENTTFYMYGLKMHPHGINIGETYPPESEVEFYNRYPELRSKIGLKQETYKNCGAMYVIKLADNSVMIIDGGEHRSMCVEQAIYLNNFLHRITNTPVGEKVRISCWFITHPHGDHMTGFVRFMNGFHEQYVLERITFNMEKGTFGFNAIKRWNPDVIYHRLHTGEHFQLADMQVDVLFTLEDLVRVGSMTCEYWREGLEPEKIPLRRDENNTSAVLRLTIDGRRILITGDTARQSNLVLMRNYAPSDFEAMRADILQIPHHAWNNLPDLYKAVRPRFSVFNQSKGGAQRGIWGEAMNTYRAVAEATEGGIANMYFSGDETVGFEVKNGEFDVVFRDIAVGYAWDGSDGGMECRWDMNLSIPTEQPPTEG